MVGISDETYNRMKQGFELYLDEAQKNDDQLGALQAITCMHLLNYVYTSQNPKQLFPIIPR